MTDLQTSLEADKSEQFTAEHPDDRTCGPSSEGKSGILMFVGSRVVLAVLVCLFALSVYMPTVSENYERERYEESIRTKGLRAPATVLMTTGMEKLWLLPERPHCSVTYRFDAPNGRGYSREFSADGETRERFAVAEKGEAVFLAGFPHDSRLIGEPIDQFRLGTSLGTLALLMAILFISFFLDRKSGSGMRRASGGKEFLKMTCILAMAAGYGWISLADGWDEYRLRRFGAETTGLVVARNKKDSRYSVQVAWDADGVRRTLSYLCAYHIHERYVPETSARIYFLPASPEVSGLADNVERNIALRYLPALLFVIGVFISVPVRILRIVMADRRRSDTVC